MKRIVLVLILLVGLVFPGLGYAQTSRQPTCKETERVLQEVNKEQSKLRKDITRDPVKDTIIRYKFLGLELLRQDALKWHNDNCREI